MVILFLLTYIPICNSVNHILLEKTSDTYWSIPVC